MCEGSTLYSYNALVLFGLLTAKKVSNSTGPVVALRHARLIKNY